MNRLWNLECSPPLLLLLTEVLVADLEADAVDLDEVLEVFREVAFVVPAIKFRFLKVKNWY
jgi:hypothetical protein